jgi:hypothetical protein
VTVEEETWVTVVGEFLGDSVPQTRWDLSHWAKIEVEEADGFQAARLFDLGPDQALGLLPSRALSSCPARACYCGAIWSFARQRICFQA